MILADVFVPLWIWPALCVVLLIAVGEWDCHRINQRRDRNRDAIEAERLARENAEPLGNVERFWP